MIRAEMKNKLHCVSHLSLATSELTLVIFGTSYGAMTSLVLSWLTWTRRRQGNAENQ